MSYSKHEWVNNETITAAKMNNIETGIEEAAQSGGGGYDIVIDAGNALTNNIANYSVVKFDVEQVKSKISANEIVTGVCFGHYNYDEDIDGDTDIWFIPLSYIGIWSTGGMMTFNHVAIDGTNAIRLEKIALTFNSSNGSLTGINDFVNTLKTLA